MERREVWISLEGQRAGDVDDPRDGHACRILLLLMVRRWRGDGDFGGSYRGTVPRRSLAWRGLHPKRADFRAASRAVATVKRTRDRHVVRLSAGPKRWLLG